MVAPLIMAALQTGGTMMAAQAKGASANAARRQERKRHRERVQAYNALIGRATGLAEKGEEQFLGEFKGELPEMAEAREALKSGQAESLQQASGQIGANLARSRVRGGQAAQAQSEAVGQIAQKGLQDIDLQAYQDAKTRRGAKGQFFGTKAGTGQRGTLTAPTF